MKNPFKRIKLPHNPLLSKEKTLYDYLEKVVATWPGTSVKCRIAHLISGVFIAGSSRSGKSSSILRWISIQWAKMIFPMVFITTRIGDANTIKEWMESAGRGDDVIVFNHQSDYCLNMLEYEQKREGGGDIANIANLITMASQIVKNFEAGGSGKNEEEYWINTTNTWLSNQMVLIQISGKELTYKNLYQMTKGALTDKDVERYRDLDLQLSNQENANWEVAYEEMNRWRENNLVIDCLEALNTNADLSTDQMAQFQNLYHYFTVSQPMISDKTRGIIISMIENILRPFQVSPLLRKHGTQGVSKDIMPMEIIKNNKIVIIDFSVKEHGLSGIIQTSIIKLLYQQEWERRDLELEGPEAKPIMFVQDEFQYYCNPAYDSLYTSTAAGSLISNVMISQNLPNIYMAMGSQSPEARAKSLLGNLSTKIFAAQSDDQTNDWMQKLIGRDFIDTESTTVRNGKVEKTTSQIMEYQIPASHMQTLKTGRKENGYEVEAIVMRTGERHWPNGKNYAEITFSQKD